MKHIFTTFILVLIGQLIFAQNDISDYSFYQSIGEYEAIVGGTELELQYATYEPSPGVHYYRQDEEITDPVDIGFTFTYGDDDFTQFRTSANGVLSFGDVDFTQYNGLIKHLDETEYQYVAPLETDLMLLFEDDPNASISYILEGESGSQVLTFLYHTKEFPDNYAWEKATINIELKQKALGLFKDIQSALKIWFVT